MLVKNGIVGVQRQGSHPSSGISITLGIGRLVSCRLAVEPCIDAPGAADDFRQVGPGQGDAKNKYRL